jgi:tRNA/rRNA methyltransferase
MKVMGLTHLSLVSPRETAPATHRDALAMASGATDVLDRLVIHESLDLALAGHQLAVAVSADTREFGPVLATPEQTCTHLVEALTQRADLRVALVFGPERTGLSIDDAQRCQLLCSIPGEPAYNSLNLSQAVQVIAYVLRRTALQALQAPVTAAVQVAPQLAPLDELEGFYGHLERGLVAIGYLDPRHPKKLMPRMRRLFNRTVLEQEEVHLLRGVFKLMEQAGNPHARTGNSGNTGDTDPQ